MKKRIIEEKKEGFFSKRKIFMYLVGIFLIVLMVGSVLNTSGEETEVYEHKGVKFNKIEGGWIGYLGEQPIVLINNPGDVQDVKVDGEGFKNLNSMSKIYLSTIPEDNIVGGIREFSRNIKLEPSVVPACFEDVEGCEELPLKNCNDANIYTGVIIFKSGENNTINFKNNCLTVEANKTEMIKVVDRLVLEWYEL